MSSREGGTHDDGQEKPLLENKDDMEATTHVNKVAKPDNDETDGEQNQMMFVVLISIMLVLVSLTFSQSLAPFMIPKYNSPSPTSQEILVFYMLVGFAIIVAMFIRKDVFTIGTSGDKPHGTRDNIKAILQNYLSIVGMSFFFPFACILDLSHIVAAVSCDEIWKLCGDEFYREYIVDVFYHLIRILFMGAELAFCCKFHGSQFKQNGAVRSGLMIVLAANLGLWFLSLVYEATERDGTTNIETIKCSNKTDHTPSKQLPENFEVCVHKTGSAHQVMNAMIRYLYPFAIEFSLLVGEFLVTKFVSHTHQKTDGDLKPIINRGTADPAQPAQGRENHIVATQEQQQPENILPGSSKDVQPSSKAGRRGPDQSNELTQIALKGDIVDSTQPSQMDEGGNQISPAEPPQSPAALPQPPPSGDVALVCVTDEEGASKHPVAKLGRLLSVFIIAIGLFASFLYIGLVFTDSFADSRNRTEIDNLNWGKVYETYSIVNYTFIIFLMVVGYACGYGMTIHRKELQGLDWLVLMSAFGPFMRQLISITALAASYTDMSPADYPDILIGSRSVNLVQLILQAPFVFLSERWRLTQGQRGHPRYLCQERILKAIIFCLATTNLTNWISDSIILTHSFSIREELMSIIFEIGNWKIVERISLPLMIFYRFNSFLLFTRAYIGD